MSGVSAVQIFGPHDASSSTSFHQLAQTADSVGAPHTTRRPPSAHCAAGICPSLLSKFELEQIFNQYAEADGALELCLIDCGRISLSIQCHVSTNHLLQTTGDANELQLQGDLAPTQVEFA